MRALRMHSLPKVEAVRDLSNWPTCPTTPWMGGFLAGSFDAEGSFVQTVLRICNTDAEIIDWLCRCLRAFHFTHVIERIHPEGRKPLDVVRITGGLREHLRFLHTVRPAVTHKLDFSGQAVQSDAPLRVVSIEPLGAMRLYDITTGTEDFIANGVISHNCYARPSHAYMGLSSGLDFETRLFYKADAAKLLRAELAKPGYVCKPIAMGSNTDPYQPVEKSFEVTRHILEVLAECMHPVTIVTKSSLVLRDVALLQELARNGLTSVTISLTSLDPEVKRTLEPRAAGPQARLRVIQQLSAAGIPVGVLIAPVIPAITDHELEDLVAAAVGAGARSVGYVLLRLPYEVKTLFREWLAEHHPLRAEHVMSLVQAMRGGRDNDPRFGYRMRGTGTFAELLRARFELACKRSGVSSRRQVELDTGKFRPPCLPKVQLDLDL
ncbi:MAG TPA: PA0069 family radical SAM protein [Steroidobacteraceae bacterium]|nr:PA0069 family radical SAM protein [Steroidobacteraceae bacterium]